MMIPDISDMIGNLDEDFGHGPDVYDSVGVVLEVLRRAGKNPVDWVVDDNPVAACEQWREVKGFPPLCVLQVPTGDALIADHLAVYLAGGMVIHATDQEVEVVSMSNLKQPVSVVEYCGE